MGGQPLPAHDSCTIHLEDVIADMTSVSAGPDDLAQAAARAGGLAPAILNAANEIAVQAFLDRQLNFPEIATVIEAVVARSGGGVVGSLEDVLAADAESRQRARERVLSSRAPLAKGEVARGARA